VSTAYLSGGIVPISHVITFVSRLVLLVTSVRSVPFWLVFIPGLAGVHPVVSCSFMMVFWLVAAQPLLARTCSVGSFHVIFRVVML